MEAEQEKHDDLLTQLKAEQNHEQIVNPIKEHITSEVDRAIEVLGAKQSNKEVAENIAEDKGHLAEEEETEKNERPL